MKQTWLMAEYLALGGRQRWLPLERQHNGARQLVGRFE